MWKYLSHAIIVTCGAFVLFAASLTLFQQTSLDDCLKYQKVILVFTVIMLVTLLLRQYQETLFRRKIGVIIVFCREGMIESIKNADSQEIIECAETSFRMTYHLTTSDQKMYFAHLEYETNDATVKEKLPLEVASCQLDAAIRVIQQNRKDIRIVPNLHELFIFAANSKQLDAPAIKRYIHSLQ